MTVTGRRAPPNFAPAAVDIEHLERGGLILRSPMKLEPVCGKPLLIPRELGETGTESHVHRRTFGER